MTCVVTCENVTTAMATRTTVNLVPSALGSASVITAQRKGKRRGRNGSGREGRAIRKLYVRIFIDLTMLIRPYRPGLPSSLLLILFIY